MEIENDYILISRALDMYANYIETGNCIVSSNDVASMGEHKPKNLKAVIKGLSLVQMKMIIRLRELSKKIEERGKKW